MHKAAKRESCYQSRDDYFQCLDYGPAESTKELDCNRYLKQFHESCPASWINYFNQQRERQILIETQVAKAKQSKI